MPRRRPAADDAPAPQPSHQITPIYRQLEADKIRAKKSGKTPLIETESLRTHLASLTDAGIGRRTKRRTEWYVS
jgi:hypothetical protein